MKSKLLLIAPAVLLGLSLSAQAAETVGGFDVSAESSIDISAGENKDSTITSRGIQLNVGRSISPNVRADLALDLAEALGRDLRVDGEDASMDFDLEKLVDELKITAHLQDGKVKVEIGKMHIQHTARSGYKGPAAGDLLYDDKKLRQTVGAVVTANPEFMSRIIDEVSVFVSEASDGAYDMDISSGEFSMGIKVTKQLTESLKLEAAHAELKAEDGSEKSVTSLGGQWKSSIYTAYGNIIITEDDLNPDDEKTQFQLGVSRGNWSADVTDDETDTRYQVAYDMNLDSKGNIKMKPYVSYTTASEDDGEDKGAEAGLEIRALFN